MMERDQFVNRLMEMMQEHFGDEYELERTEVTKNNGIVYDAVILHMEDSNAAPVVYLDYLYEDYLDGSSLDDIIMKVKEYTENERTLAAVQSAKATDFEKCKDMIMAKLINAERNAELLERGIPHRKLLDLAIVYYIFLDANDDRMYTTIITDALLKYWNVTEEVLYDLAMSNMEKKLPAKVSRLEAVLFGDESEEDEMLFTEDSQYPELLLMTNSYNVHGAITVLYPGILQEIADRNHTDLVVLPSSVHEILIMKDDGKMTREEIDRMIQSINDESVRRDEVLADHAYVFQWEKGELVITDMKNRAHAA